MATVQMPPQSSAPTIGSYQTALCIIPPARLHPKIDSLRALYDKAHGKWPPHINLIYPFVAIENLPQATDIIRSKLLELGPSQLEIKLQLDLSGQFCHRHSNTVFIAPSKDTGDSLEALRSAILESFKRNEDGQEYHPHLTIGQTPANAPPMLEYLLDKAKLLLPIDWEIDELVVLVRERMPDSRKTESRMKVWGSINLSWSQVMNAETSLSTRYPLRMNDGFLDEPEKSPTWSSRGGHNSHSPGTQKILWAKPETTYCFYAEIGTWKAAYNSPQTPSSEQAPSSFKISSYNVLHDPTLTMSTEERYPILLKSITSDSAASDVLILQEVSDSFLSYLLSNTTIRARYPFATHTPANPLASLRNIVVLSRWNFTWEKLLFEQRHKGAVIFQSGNIGTLREGVWTPVIVVGVHLSSGLSDSGAAARKSQLQGLLWHLSKKYPNNPWIVAGDFNIATSKASIEEALDMKAISAETGNIIESLIPMLEETGLADVWVTVGSDTTEDTYDGDEGATFDPTKNALAAETVRNAGSKNMRPRRYDRVFVKGDDFLEAVDFNMFGLQDTNSDKTTDVKGKDWDAMHWYGSDHYGIRATLSVGSISSLDDGHPQLIEAQLSGVKILAAPPSLSNPYTLHAYLNAHSALPSEIETQQRREVLDLLVKVLQSPASETRPTPHSSIILLPVGSYALETYLPTSDLDVLAIGSLSAPSFFTNAVRRLQIYAKSGVKILRKVDAATGTMLELEIRGIKCDLQYCCAPSVVSKWQEISELEPTDPAFQLPIQALQKLNSYRDIEYLKHALSVNPGQMQEFQLAHRFLHIWARERGIYAGKFGFLNGFALTLMLFRIIRSLPLHNDAVRAHGLIATFFGYYATFDWAADIVHDPAFAVEKKRYRRSAREVMVVLSLHAPRVNVLRAASLPAVRTMTEEIMRAERLLKEPGVTWDSLIDGNDADTGGRDVEEFLTAYKSYVKIDVNYWGSSAAKASSLVGWLESKCVVLLVDISRKLPNIHARIWPARFMIHDKDVKGSTEDFEFQGFYLIGLKKLENVKEPSISDSDRKLAQNILRTSLENFAHQIRGDEQYFDSSTSWVGVSNVKQSELGNLQLDKREWGANTAEDSTTVAKDEDQTHDSDFEIEFGNDSDNEERDPSVSKTKSKSIPPRKGTKATTKPVSFNKLRPASDILSRLRWDPDLNSNDYAVGYIDRFLGTKEQGLDTWKSEQTDEEFIPQHRIVYFRRKSDDVRVWDRETRLDLIFGSGVGKG